MDAETIKKLSIEKFVEDINEILPGSPNNDMYHTLLSGKTVEEFEELIKKIESGEIILPIYQPNLSDDKLEVERNIALAEKWGLTIRHRIRLTDPINPELTYLTNIRYPVLPIIVRRQQQTLDDKMAVPMHNDEIDELSGQVTGESKGSALTIPEEQVLKAGKFDKILHEMLIPRGGNMDQYRLMEQAIIDTGEVSLSELKVDNSHVKSVVTLSSLLTSAHLSNNLKK